MKALIRDLLLICIKPTYWMQLNPYDDAWDDALNRLMKKHKFVDIGRHSATINGYKVWTSNHPYASFSPYPNGAKREVRPSRLTILRAHRKLMFDSAYADIETNSAEYLRRKAIDSAPLFEWLRRHK